MLQLFYSATFVEMTSVAQTIAKFMKSRTFYQKLPLFIKNYPHFIKNYRWPPEKKLKYLISPFIKNSIFGNNRDPWIRANQHRGGDANRSVALEISPLTHHKKNTKK